MTLSTTAPSDHGIRLAERIRKSAGALLAAIWRAYKLHTCRRMLQDLPDEILKDIGITRSDIRTVARLIIDQQIDDSRRSLRFGRNWRSL